MALAMSDTAECVGSVHSPVFLTNNTQLHSLSTDKLFVSLCKTTVLQVLVLRRTCWLTLGKLLSLSGPCAFHLEIEIWRAG